jgi:glycosyltransferase involved in cell wall biosynthesis
VLVHVTAFNDLMWDAGSTRTVVIEHGVSDPGYRYTGELPAAAVVINEPVRRWRVTGTDLLPRFTQVSAVDVFGMVSDELPGRLPVGDHPVRAGGDLRTETLHTEMSRRRFYLHPVRWTSLGLSLIEAMQLGMPVIALATTDAVEAIPAGAGTVSTDVDRLLGAAQQLINEPQLAVQQGKQAREAALGRYGLARFLADWDHLVNQVLNDSERGGRR